MLILDATESLRLVDAGLQIIVGFPCRDAGVPGRPDIGWGGEVGQSPDQAAQSHAEQPHPNPPGLSGQYYAE